MFRIVVSDDLQTSGIDALREQGAEVVLLEDRAQLPDVIGEFDALIVRSATKVTGELMEKGLPRLKVVGRAGIGVDNIDIPKATELGILVVNSPTANMMSATEHTFALMLAVSRMVPAADARLKSGVWDRKSFVGQELQGKTLGIIGLGQIGKAVAERARAFGMKVLAFDPFLDAEAARRLGVELRKLDAMLPECDVITFHTPLTDQTRNLLDEQRIATLKPGVLVINCGRGGVIDEDALLAAIVSGHVGGAGLDVFAQEPPVDRTLVEHPRVVATPHIGASTHEAQDRIGTQIAEMVMGALKGSLEIAAVNLPFRPAGGDSGPWLMLADKLGRLASSISSGGLRRVQIDFHGIDEAQHVPLTVAAVKGTLAPFLGEKVNYVNAEHQAADRGIEVVRASHASASDYAKLISVTVEADGGSVKVAGTLYGDGDPRVVQVVGFRLEFKPGGRMLILRNDDVPGFVGRLGTMLGAAGVNIADIHLARNPGTSDALAVLRLDQTPAADLLDALHGLEEVRSTWVIELP